MAEAYDFSATIYRDADGQRFVIVRRIHRRTGEERAVERCLEGLPQSQWKPLVRELIEEINRLYPILKKSGLDPNG
jgi:hypothetical protein